MTHTWENDRAEQASCSVLAGAGLQDQTLRPPHTKPLRVVVTLLAAQPSGAVAVTEAVSLLMICIHSLAC